MNDGIYRTRSEAAKDARDKRLRAWFGKRRWRVMTEMSGERRQRLGVAREMSVVRYDQGEFWIITRDRVFQTPFGYKGRHGFLIIEVDPETGADLNPLSVAAFGYGVLTKAQELFKSFPDGLPAERQHPPHSA